MEENGLSKKEKREFAKMQKQQQLKGEEGKSNIKKYLIFAGIAALIFYLGFKFINYINTPQPDFSEPLQVADGDWVKGDRQAKAVMVEYGDFQCPACALYAPYVTDLNKDFPEGLQIIYRHMPLVTIHPNAIPAAQAAEAAGLQGKFWEMHDILFDKQDEWAKEGSLKEKFVEYARQLELDEEKFLADYESEEVKEEINNDIFTANRLNVNSTPSFFLNGKKIQPGNYQQFKDLIEAEINK